jgi:bacterioferritin-associated ferredoxin
MYVCVCRELTDSDFAQAARAGIRSAEALAAFFELDSEDCCGYCLLEIDRLVERVTSAGALNEQRSS